MKRLFIISLLILSFTVSQAQWKIAGNKIKTQWAEEVSPQNVWSQYPRPEMARSQWKSLNGLWNYAISGINDSCPNVPAGQILVPFALESALSGVQGKLLPDQTLWYSTEFEIPSKWKGNDIILNFGAVDWRADVEVNGIQVGSHTGGFAPFSFNITEALNPSGKQTLCVRVWDPTDTCNQPVGKQRMHPKRIWYTPVSGIWQTVWIEPVPKANRILKVLPKCDIKRSELLVNVRCASDSGIVCVEAFDSGNKVAEASSVAGNPVILRIANAKLWDTSNPFLYDLKVTLKKNGKEIDSVDSYAAFREIDTYRDALGHMRVRLNGKNIFMYGPLDQGWWPDGLYTAPTDEALAYDVKFTKRIGFNTIRKHIKIEPARWYYHCDREGILVWQDMPSGENNGYIWARNQIGAGTDKKLSDGEKENFYKEFKEIIDELQFHPSVVVWVPFNEAWSQFDTEKVTEWVKKQDPTRLVNPASGGNLRLCGDIIDIHHYPNPIMPIYDSERVVVLGEYGGIGYPVKGHLWKEKKNWGYVKYNSGKEVTDEYVRFAEEIIPYIHQGMSSAIYTQTTDVEIEVNGFLTYDRKVMKMDEKRIREVNQKVINSLK